MFSNTKNKNMYYSTNSSNVEILNGYFSAQKKIEHTQKKDLDFFSFVDFFMNKYSHQYSKETKKTYRTQKSKLKKFRKNLKLNEINRQFIYEYEKYMTVELGNNRNTILKTYAFLKSTLNKAINEGIISKEHNPFNSIKIGRIEGKRDFLTKKEINKIEKLRAETNNEAIKNVCSYFLFSCYTGLRFADIKNLQSKHIVNNIIEIKQHKTKDFVRVPLNNKALSLLPTSYNGYLFRVVSNQKTNENLKKIAKLTDISKTLTFHVARHTFATVGLSLGIPIEVISKLLGHKKISTTQIYAKVVDEIKINEIKKFDLF